MRLLVPKTWERTADMEKVHVGTADLTEENIERLAELFPQVATEVTGEDGQLERAIDFDALRALLGDVAEGGRERYQFTWPGKQEARAEAFTPVDKTLRPCPEKSVDWDATQNLYIEGDNLDALKILHETYAGKVKLIYIDPPYNTGHDFIYHDDYRQSREDYEAASGEFDEEGGRLVANTEGNGRFHSDWCSMMYPRLLLARDLLREDGAIFISIDDNEVANLRKLCDEVFGEGNFVADVVWEKTTQPTNSGEAKFGVQKKTETILLFAKNRLSLGRFHLEAVSDVACKYPHDGRFGKCRFEVIEKSDAGTYSRPTMKFKILGQYPREGKRWQIGEETARALEQSGKVEIVNGVVKRAYYPEDETDKQIYKPFWSLLDAKKVGTALDGKAELNALLSGAVGFDTVKPSRLISYVIARICTAADSLILDFFSGSATTADAVMQLNAEDGGNRKFIMVQLPEVCAEDSEAAKAGYATICDIGEERIRRAGAKITSELEAENAQLKLGEDPKPLPDLGFRVLRVDSSNFRDVSATPEETTQTALFDAVDNVKAERSELDLLFEVLPAFRIPYSAAIEECDIAGKRCFVVDGNYLIACFDVGVTTETIEQIAKLEPVYAVMRDASMADDATQANFEELFRTHSPGTIRRVI